MSISALSVSYIQYDATGRLLLRFLVKEQTGIDT